MRRHPCTNTGPVVLLFLGILAGIWLNRRDFADLKADTTRQIADLKADMNRRFTELNERFDQVNRWLDGVDAELKRFIKLEGRVEEISRR